MHTHFCWAPFPLAKDKVKVIPSWTLGPKLWGTKPTQLRQKAAGTYCHRVIWNHGQKNISESIIFILIFMLFDLWVTAAIFKNKQFLNAFCFLSTGVHLPFWTRARLHVGFYIIHTRLNSVTLTVRTQKWKRTIPLPDPRLNMNTAWQNFS